MNRNSLTLIFVLPFFLFLGCKALPEGDNGRGGSGKTPPSPQAVLKETQLLDSLLIHHQYFKLRDHLKGIENRLPRHTFLFYKALTQAAFNQKKESNDSLDTLINRYPDQLNDLKRVLLLETAA